MTISIDNQYHITVKTRKKNLCSKTRHFSNPYEVWVNDHGWTWNVLKKWQVDDDKPYARWFCFVTSPLCPQGEYGDVYVAEVKGQARLKT